MIQLKDVTVDVGKFQLKNMNLTIPKGYTVGCIGRNGAGKSSLIKTLMGLYLPTEGDVLWEDEKLSIKMKEKIGFIYDDLYFARDMKLKNMRRILQTAYPTWDNNYYEKLLYQFKLDENKKIKELSKGMKMKAQFAFALAHHPDVLIMDEPTSGLDPVFRRTFVEMLRDWMTEKERILFFSTHITSDLEQFADYILFLDEGEVRFFLPIDEVEDRFVIVKGNMDDIKQIQSKLYRVDIRGNQFTALLDQKQHVVDDSYFIQRATLEDIMYFMTEVVSCDKLG